MKFNLQFDMDNAAFELESDQASIVREVNTHEIQRILAKVSAALGDCIHGDTIKDINGNTVGSWDIEPGVNDPEYLS